MRLLREGYSERLFLRHDEREGVVVRKQAKPDIGGTLQAEIDWLGEVPQGVRRYFPRVLRSGREPQADGALFYEMPYFGQEWVLLSELILTGALNHAQSLALVAHIMRVMFEGVFPVTYAEAREHYVDQLVVLIEHSVRGTARIPAFAPFLFADTVVLNGREQWNVMPLLERLKYDAALQRALRPAVIRKVHGDLYPENVLVHLPSLRRPAPWVMFLDPIAAIGLSRGDFAMDVAKFQSWLSAELVTVRLGLFSVKRRAGVPAAFTLTLHTDDPRVRALRDGVVLREVAHVLDTAPWARTVGGADPHWRRRVSFYEALYALSMVPLVPPSQSLARFLVGLRHLNEFVAPADERWTARLPAATTLAVTA